MSDKYFLAKGSHASRGAGMCSMEWISYLAGEPHSDQPQCVSPVLTQFGMGFNDALPDDERQRLRPYLARMIGTRNDGLDEQRGWLCADWLVRTYAPAWLALAGLDGYASDLRGLPPLLAAGDVFHARSMLCDAHAQAVAAGVSAVGAAGMARIAAQEVAWVATRIAAGISFQAVAGVVARTVGWAAFAPTALELPRSLFDLLDRMLPTEPIQLPADPETAENMALERAG